MNRLAILSAFIVALIFAAPHPASAEEARPVHLILLSGQSNMANLDPARVFIPKVQKHFGAEKVVVVKDDQKRSADSALVSRLEIHQ